ncbi:MAG: GspE/PulE family protein [Candidatus Pacebacteria bacterium]|nr:GspE/PulE family protein [Candidatus Paceibacterota bacterium]
MRIPTQKLKEFLIKDGLIAEANFDTLAMEAERQGYDVADVLVSRNIISKTYLTGLLSAFFGVEEARLGERQIDESVLKLLPEELSRQRRVIVFNKQPDGFYSVAMEDPGNLETIEFLERYLKGKVRPYLASEDDLNKGFALYGLRLSESFKKIIEQNIAESLRLGKRGEEAAAEVPIVAIVDNLVNYAFSSRASDIHFEIFEDEILIRYRIDGVLFEIIRISKEVHAAIVARVKLLAGLKIDEHYKPQDGRFRMKIGTSSLDIRVSVIPTYYGEKVEMRLLASAQRPLSLQELGMLEDMQKIVMENIAKTYGMVLVCGPTGSGKTTTLYSLLNMLNRPEVNIVTVEDPIEYDIKYVNQTQINPQAGITFAGGLRSILRQDPNIILVGEIRDEETAGISVQSALTGHLVLSSLHTNDAPTTVPRLIDMKVVPFLVSAVLNVIIAQRLVRKICHVCIYSKNLSENEQKTIEDQSKEFKIEGSEIKIPKIVYEGKGCPACGGSGYQGRMAIFEVMEVTEAIRKFIVSPEFSLDGLRIMARKYGMISMFEDGLRKAETGMTTLEEVLRVIRE